MVRKGFFMKIFDAHFHILPEPVYRTASFYNESWGGLDGHLNTMDEAGVCMAVASYPTTDFHAKNGLSEIRASRVYNEAMKKISDESGGRIRFLAALPITETDEMLAETKRAVEDGAVGLSLPTNRMGVYPDGQALHPFFCEVARLGLPVFFHPTTQTPFGYGELKHPLITPVFQYAFDTTLCLAKVVDSGLLETYPELKLVFASFGGAMPFFAGRFDRTYRMLLGRGIVKEMGAGPKDALRKVYVDTSGTDSAAILTLAVEVFGEDRVLWGSDFPANRDVLASINAVCELGIGGAAAEKILYRNLAGLIR